MRSPGNAPRPDGSRRSRRLYPVAAVLALIAFMTVIVFQLPYDRLTHLAIERASTAAGIRIRYARSALGWRGVILSDVELCLAPHPVPPGRDTQSIQVDRLALRPSLWGLLRGRNGVPWTARAQLYDGSARAIIDGSSAEWRLHAEWTEINLGRLPAWRPDGRITGVSDGRINASATAANTHGGWAISARRLAVHGLRSGQLVLPPLEASRANTVGTWTGRRLMVEALDAQGAFGELHLAGRIMLRDPLEKSALSMRMTHVVPSQPPPELALFLKILLPGAATGQGTYTIGGTLGLPSITPRPST